ncbi:high-affinity branched-chain amino acid transport ATP-binding protein LivF [Acidithrix ferrooxidans]|uniref:High-affinity branched-chain amino acid transport ATP-binding protein LivF n=1 Tax=Acidithrix ferrooxidans TaxID=1280514 RepID=A0A0D8HII1_9ACTN|nr:high-affinity branched-chain amino acid transport ATP-binding protein LivF [Acidithrix ferrooxidans]
MLLFDTFDYWFEVYFLQGEKKLLIVEGLSASYGPVKALRGVTMSVDRSKITAVLGANGAGKTTLLRTLSGLVKAIDGSASIDGLHFENKNPEDIARMGISHVPEGRGVVQEMTVDENLRLGAIWKKDFDIKSKLNWVYELFPPLLPRSAKAAFTLSGGERQMLAVGRALMSEPKALLLDEPSLGLAPLVTAGIMSLLRKLCDDQGLAVLLVEQNARSALSVADEAVVLSLGEVVVSDKASAIKEDAALRHHYLGF